MNWPNRLSLLRVGLVPLVVLMICLGDPWSYGAALVLFLAGCLTDWADGWMARRYRIVTNFGKFMDPLADKFMIFGALIAICASDFIIADDLTVPHWLLYNVFLWSTLAVVFRELAVTSMRLVVSRESGVVVAANMLGKIKTVSQFVCIIVVLLEPIVFPTGGFLSLFSMVIMVVFTIWSGVHYIRQYWNFLDPSV